MDSFASFFESQSSSRTSWSYDSLKNFRQISPTVQNHLKQVYLSLCCALIASAAGAYLHVLWNIGGLLTTIGCMATMVWLLSTPPHEEQKRVSLLMAAGVLEGASIGPLIDLAIDFDPSILVGAFVGTAMAFACFSAEPGIEHGGTSGGARIGGLAPARSALAGAGAPFGPPLVPPLAAAMLAKRREYLYLGGLLSSGVSILLWLHFASSIFGGSVAMFKFELYFGLLIFVGYMVVDTQDIIEKAHRGDLDYVKHALTLFTDFIAVFVRILIIMLRNASDKEEQKKKKRRN